jgi:hypothetical protein
MQAPGCAYASEVRRSVTREFFRIVRGEQPSRDDFRSLGDLGKACVSGRRFRECAEGVSVFDDFTFACELARTYRFQRGRYIAKLIVPEDGSVDFAKTFGMHHFTIYYGSPESILHSWTGRRFESRSFPEAKTMNTYYELFDLESGIVIEDFDLKSDAIEALVLVVERHGFPAIGTYALTRVESGKPVLIAMQEELVARVERDMERLFPQRRTS